MFMKKVVMYIKTYCPYCKKATELLASKGVEFTKIDVMENEQLFDEIKQKTGSKTVPQIFIDDEFIGGCDDLHALDASKKLDAMLGL